MYIIYVYMHINVHMYIYVYVCMYVIPDCDEFCEGYK